MMSDDFLAAKEGDILVHKSLLADGLSILIEVGTYAAIGFVAGVVIVGSCGTGAAVVGAVVAGAVGAGAGEAISKDADKTADAIAGFFGKAESPDGLIISGSPNVHTKSKPAARAAGSIPNEVLIAQLQGEAFEAMSPDEQAVFMAMAEQSELLAAEDPPPPSVPESAPLDVPKDQGWLESEMSPIVAAKDPNAHDREGDTISCSKTHFFQGDELFLAEGSKSVLINSQPACRNGDRSTCEAVIKHTQTNRVVRIGGSKAVVRDIKSGKSPLFAAAALALSIVTGRGLIKMGIKKALKKAPCMLMGMVAGAAGGMIGSSLSGNPIHYATGSKVLFGDDELDFSLPGRQSIVWQRIYNSHNEIEGMLGYGWRLFYETHFDIRQSSHNPRNEQEITYHDASGRMLGLGHIPIGESMFYIDEGIKVVRISYYKFILVTQSGENYIFGPLKGDASKLVLQESFDGYGNPLYYRYDEHNRLVVIESNQPHYGIELSYSSAHSNRVSAIYQRLKEGAGVTLLVKYHYNDRAELIEVTDADDVILRRFAYDELSGKLCAHQNQHGLLATYDWHQLEGQWYVRHHRLLDGSVCLEELSLEYDLEARKLVVTHSDKGKSYHYWNEAKLVTFYRNYADECWTFEWDENELLKTVRDPKGGETQYIHDERGNICKEINPLGEVTLTQWDATYALPTMILLPNGESWQYTYNNQLSLIREIAPDKSETRYVYNEVGECVAIVDALNNQQKLQYDEWGLMTASQDCSGHSTRYLYHSNGFLYRIIDPNNHSTTYEYSNAGRVTGITLADKRQRLYQYNHRGQLAGVKNFDGHTTQFEYTVRGNIHRVKKPDGHQIQYHYDKVGDLVELVNEKNRSYRFQYDVLGRLTQQIDLIGQVKSYTYNAASELTEMLTEPAADDYDSQPILVQYEYDALSRITAETIATSRIEFQYGKNQVDINRYRKETSQDAALSTPMNTQGQMTLAVTPWLKVDTLTFEYDAMGRLTREKNHGGTFTNQYDALGNLTQIELPDGAQFIHHYYGSGHLFESRFIRGEKNFLVAEYTRDKLHREITRSQGALNLETRYDATGRITRHSLRKTSQSAAFHPLRENRYEYSDVNELISRHILNGDDKSPLTFAKSLSEYFEYDTNGQVLVHSPALEMKYLQEEHYKYDAAGNLITDDFHPPHWTNQTTRHKGQTYHYDGFGRLVQIKQQENVVKQFEYDEHHRMIKSVAKQGHDEWVAQYEYDALSRRISKTSQYYTDVYDHHRTLVEYKSKKQLFYWQGLRLAGESEASRLENRRWYAYEENSYAPLALIDHWHEIDKDEIVYYHTQLNGAPYALSSAQGELIFETDEYLWGNYRRPAKNQVTLLYGQPLRFQGQYFDQETGLHYNTFRYYEPETGRFTQQDPIGLAGGINLYQYSPNPLAWTDVLGLAKEHQINKYSELTSKAHVNDKLDAHELIRNKLLNNIGVSNDIKNRVGDNPSIALTRKQHLEVHRQEIKLREKLGLGRNQMHDSFSVELDIAAQSLRNAGIPNGKIKRLLEHAKRFWGRLAIKNKCSG